MFIIKSEVIIVFGKKGNMSVKLTKCQILLNRSGIDRLTQQECAC